MNDSTLFLSTPGDKPQTRLAGQGCLGLNCVRLVAWNGWLCLVSGTFQADG